MFSLLQSDALSSQLAERDSKIEQLETQLKQTKSEAEKSSRKLQEAVRLVKHRVFSFHIKPVSCYHRTKKSLEVLRSVRRCKKLSTVNTRFRLSNVASSFVSSHCHMSCVTLAELSSLSSAADATSSGLRSEVAGLRAQLSDLEQKLQKSQRRTQELEEVKVKLVSGAILRQMRKIVECCKAR